MTWLPARHHAASISPWNDESLTASWVRISTAADQVATSVGEGPNFHGKKAIARKLLRRGDTSALRQACADDPRLHRAVVSVWAEDEDLTERSLSQDSLDVVFGQARFNRMTVNTLISVLLRDFTRLEAREEGLFEYITQLIRSAATQLTVSPRARTSLVKTVQEHPGWLLDSRAPATVAAHLTKTRLDLDDYLTEIGVRGSSGGTYAQSIRHALYLDTLRSLDPATSDPLLTVISEPAVFRAPTPEGGYFGHQLLEVLCSPSTAPGDGWRDAILRIAGDPRLAHTGDWTTWWATVDQTIRAKVIGWLSTEDLRLFLAAVEEFAQSNGHDEILRMFPARKYFLEGLLELNLVRETRLFMGTSAWTHLRARLGRKVLSDISPLTGAGAPDTAIIFVDCGDFHIIEGSHNFKLWIYNGRPGRLIGDRRRGSFTLNRLRRDVPIDFLADRGLSNADISRSLLQSRWHASVRHNQKWQQNTLAALRQFGINLPPKLLMNSDTYEKYRRAVGLTPASSAGRPRNPTMTRSGR
jgi:hypothetical protein